jgi:hypothetical protein
LSRGVTRVLVGWEQAPLPGWPGWRGLLYGWLIRLLFGGRMRIADSPVRLLRREIFSRIPLQSDGSFAHAEIVVKANFLGRLLHEVPVRCRPRPQAQTPQVTAPLRQTLAEMRRILADPDFGPAVLPTETQRPEIPPGSGEAARTNDLPAAPG